MKSYLIDDLRDCLIQGGLSGSELVMVHSSLFGLGRLRNHTAKETPSAIAECIQGVVGPAGTIVVPAFCFDFCRGKVFDRQNSPSEKMGVFSEWIRRLPTAKRSKHPMQSVAAIGPLANSICNCETASAFDEGGAFDKMRLKDAKLILLGVNFQAASVIHFSEQKIGVPYRYWKDFTGPYHDQGQESSKTYRMYVRDLELDPKLRMDPIEQELIERKQIQHIPIGAGLVRICSFQDLIAAADDCLAKDPWCLAPDSKK